MSKYLVTYERNERIEADSLGEAVEKADKGARAGENFRVSRPPEDFLVTVFREREEEE